MAGDSSGELCVHSHRSGAGFGDDGVPGCGWRGGDFLMSFEINRFEAISQLVPSLGGLAGGLRD
jgi:hypothetical protein